MLSNKIHSTNAKVNKKIKLGVIIATIVAAMSYISTAVDFVGKVRSIFSETTTDPHFLGRWNTYWEYSPIGRVSLGFRGTSEFFKNGRYNSSGIMTVVDRNSAPDPVRVEYLASWAGTWSVANKGITTTMDVMKTTPSTIAFGTKELPANEIMQILGRDAHLPELKSNVVYGGVEAGS